MGSIPIITRLVRKPNPCEFGMLC